MKCIRVQVSQLVISMILIINNSNIYCFIFIFLHFNYKSTLHIFKNNTFSITVQEHNKA